MGADAQATRVANFVEAVECGIFAGEKDVRIARLGGPGIIAPAEPILRPSGFAVYI